MDENYSSTAAATIRPISSNSVHRICSGQVVLSLAVALKELVENSLDANSTNIEIRLKEYGAELIEVLDNGSGVKEEDFQNLTLKHYTSKLKDFSDLELVDTFGFRGEALSSLCALSNVTIVTCHQSAACGTRIDYDCAGKITKKCSCSRQVGTTVILKNLFGSLPVRHKEFQKNVKREFTKALNVLYGYCLINPNIRLSCCNQVGQTKTTVLSVNGKASFEENVHNIFGPKQMSLLMEIQSCTPSPEILEEYRISECSLNAIQDGSMKVCGYISKAAHGCCRSSCDRQFCFVNGRPCELNKVTKLVNELFRSYTVNKHQYPFLFLNITLKKENIDVNVTPDKRQIFLHNEKALLAIVKASLLKRLEPQTSVIDKAVPASFQTSLTQDGDSVLVETEKSKLTQTDFDTVQQLKRVLSEEDVVICGNVSKVSTEQKKQKKLRQERLLISFVSPKRQVEIPVVASSNVAGKDDSLRKSCSKTLENDVPSPPVSDNSSLATSNSLLNGDEHIGEQSSDEEVNYVENQVGQLTSGDFHTNIEEFVGNVTNVELNNSVEKADVEETTDVKNTSNHSSLKKITMVPFSIDDVREKLHKEQNRRKESSICKQTFFAKIDPSSNEAAEKELQREISKSMFTQMVIVGQFNLGFIIAKLNSDLFIIDQHAADEKYNFEMLEKTTSIDTQKLISGQSLDLTVSSETILLDNLKIFQMNGFDFDVDMSANAGFRLKLMAVPRSKDWTFGKQDIEEMLYVLSDSSSGMMYRPSRIRQMFASRACRMSVKIGTAIDQQEMKKVVTHMGEMNQPWNCPHGRPTMRHLCSLNMV